MERRFFKIWDVVYLIGLSLMVFKQETVNITVFFINYKKNMHKNNICQNNPPMPINNKTPPTLWKSSGFVVCVRLNHLPLLLMFHNNYNAK